MYTYLYMHTCINTYIVFADQSLRVHLYVQTRINTFVRRFIPKSRHVFVARGFAPPRAGLPRGAASVPARASLSDTPSQGGGVCLRWPKGCGLKKAAG